MINQDAAERLLHGCTHNIHPQCIMAMPYSLDYQQEMQLNRLRQQINIAAHIVTLAPPSVPLSPASMFISYDAPVQIESA